MQTKQKVTLYLSPELHRQLKIRSAVESEPMSELAERAIIFYLSNSEIVDEVEGSYGRTHKVYSCPECSTSVVLREGDLSHLNRQPGVLDEDDLAVEQVQKDKHPQQGEEELVPC
ncbi:MAG: hypothetical protein VKL59_17675 [Nostocaceae cyanobacterium]|nr:hypothetical protein [Nostocaceae cyanobacterium]